MLCRRLMYRIAIHTYHLYDTDIINKKIVSSPTREDAGSTYQHFVSLKSSLVVERQRNERTNIWMIPMSCVTCSNKCSSTSLRILEIKIRYLWCRLVDNLIRTSVKWRWWSGNDNINWSGELIDNTENMCSSAEKISFLFEKLCTELNARSLPS